MKKQIGFSGKVWGLKTWIMLMVAGYGKDKKVSELITEQEKKKQ
jgi:hypothetical protein